MCSWWSCGAELGHADPPAPRLRRWSPRGKHSSWSISPQQSSLMVKKTHLYSGAKRQRDQHVVRSAATSWEQKEDLPTDERMETRAALTLYYFFVGYVCLDIGWHISFGLFFNKLLNSLGAGVFSFPSSVAWRRGGCRTMEESDRSPAGEPLPRPGGPQPPRTTTPHTHLWSHQLCKGCKGCM